MSSTKPKLTALDVKSTNPRVYPGLDSTLLCPLQGFPVPGFRSELILVTLHVPTELSCPKFKEMTHFAIKKTHDYQK